MNKAEYHRYLASREWAVLKEQVRARSEGFCERCAVGPYQETHHLTYEHVGAELLDDLLAVCSPCHAFLSAKSNEDPAENVKVVVLAVAGNNCSAQDAVIETILNNPGLRAVGHPTGIVFSIDRFHRLPAWAEKDKNYQLGSRLEVKE